MRTLLTFLLMTVTSICSAQQPIYGPQRIIGWQDVPITIQQPIYAPPQVIGWKYRVLIEREHCIPRALFGKYKERTIIFPQPVVPYAPPMSPPRVPDNGWRGVQR